MADERHVTLVEAIENKYSSDPEESFEFICLPKKGAGKQGSDDSLILPTNLVLDNSNISSAGDKEKIKELCKNVKELDLTKNALTDWKDVLSILGCIPRLQFLNLCSNDLDNNSWPSEDESSSFCTLQHLILNKTGVSWDVTHKILKLCPKLTELHLSLNEYPEITFAEPFQEYPMVKKLHLSKNKIQKGSELQKVGKIFPSLEQLVNIESDLQSLKGESDNDDGSWKENFPHLRSLVLSQNRLGSWEDFEMLRNLPLLVDLKVLGIPFLDEMEKNVRRQELIARLPNITCLDGTPITGCEREDADRAFIRLYMDKEEKSARFNELEEQYGKLEPLAEVNMTPKNILKLKLVTPEDLPTQEKEIEINIKQTVKDLMKALSNITSRPASRLKVYHRQVINNIPIVSDDIARYQGSKFLWTLNMSEECELVCEDKKGKSVVNNIPGLERHANQRQSAGYKMAVKSMAIYLKKQAKENGEPITFVEAIENKYIFDGQNLVSQSNTNYITNLELEGMNIDRAGDPEKIKKYCHHVTDIQLNGNRISQWSEIFPILECVPNLQNLVLSNNEIDDGSWPFGKVFQPCSAVRTLNLTKTGISWVITHRLLCLFPYLEELHLSMNDGQDIVMPDVDVFHHSNAYNSLKRLSLCKHTTQSWYELQKIGRLFPNLEGFSSTDGNLRNLGRGNERHNKDINNYFPKLQCLTLYDTKIESWEDLEMLGNISSITELMLLIQSVEKFTKLERQSEILVRFPNVSLFNTIAVTEDMRESSEIMYVRTHMDKEEKPYRFEELEEKYRKLGKL